MVVTAALAMACFLPGAKADVTVISGSLFTYTGYVGQGLTAVPADPVDIAVATNGGTPFASSLISNGGYSAHQIDHLNDGLYGNNYSWIGGSAQTVDLGGSYGTVNMSFAGVELNDLYDIKGFSFGRSNLGEYGDRIGGTMYVQIAPAADVNLTDTSGTYDSLWTTIGAITKTDTYDHVFTLDTPLTAAGIRIVTNNGNCIDEFAMYGSVYVPGPIWTGGGDRQLVRGRQLRGEIRGNPGARC